MLLHYFLESALFALIFMILGFILSRIIKLVSLIDALWPLTPLLISFMLLMRTPYSFTKILLFSSILIWSLRLSFFIIWTRVLKKHEDSRYKKILPDANSKKKELLIFFQFIFQWFLQICLSLSFLPFFWTSKDPSYFLLIGGFILALLCVLGEAKADSDLLVFKRKKTGSFLTTGLWAYSRHPNYFFDWLFWVAIGVMGSSLSLGGLSFIGSIIMWIIFNYLTGPLTERLSLKKYKEPYSSYLKKVPFMIPHLSFFKKSKRQ